MAKKISGITIAIGADTTGVTNGLKDIGKQSNSVNSELRDVERLLKLNPNNVELVAQKQQLLSKQVELTTKKLDGLKGAQADVDRQFKSGDIGEEQYRAFQREVVATEGRLDHYKQSLKDVESSSGEAGNATKGLGGKFDELGQSVEDVGEAVKGGVLMEAADHLSVVGDKLKEFSGSAQEAFSDVDEGMDKITTTTGKASDEFKTQFDNIISSMAVDSFEDVGSALGTLSAQFDMSGDTLEKNSKLALQYANINDTDVKTSIESAKSAIEAYGLSNKDFSTVLDSVTATSQRTGVAVDSLFDSAVKGAPQIKDLGLNFSQGTELLGQFSKAGVDGDAALSSLSKASIIYAKGNKSLSEGLGETIEKIKNAKTKQEALTEAATIFGTKGASRMVDAIQRGAFNLSELGDVAKKSNGTISDTFNKTVDDIDEQQIASQQAKVAMSEFGAAIATGLKPLLDLLVPLLKFLGQAFGSLPGPIKTILVVIGGLIIAFTALMPIIASMAVGLPALGAVLGITGAEAGGAAIGFGALSTSLLPIIAIVAAVIAIIALVVIAVKNWGAITDWFSDKWDGLKKWWSDFWGQFSSPVDGAFKWLEQSIKTISAFMFGSFDDKVNAIKNLFKFLKLKFPKIEIPHIPMPHFSFSGTFNPLKGKLPKIGVDWFAKGGILTKPTVFGQNGNSLMVGGEAGKEAVAPLSDLMGYVEKAVANQMGNTGGDEIHLHFTAYGAMPKETMDQMAEYMMYKLGELNKQKGLG
ncbi:phage tail tape measure protein [Lactococcus lactis subsp. lactis]|uniref:phage tail tape measure protein n=1 Tax=Lactococcus lactis TaxID=1358 RepID=UPI001BAA3471|nr:phage tail tape measure protein [Lactococcus lactis]MBR8674084.1 phage tail tape measure protein [Lactococcus lactis subsp. lactis]MBR8676957.1 phage tail tape measure protein [Lactococcus lactis subsp. lactis]MBR8684256.1 phage tail tape measure protein [Lactococcus lactis subsp. lactis]